MKKHLLSVAALTIAALSAFAPKALAQRVRLGTSASAQGSRLRIGGLHNPTLTTFRLGIMESAPLGGSLTIPAAAPGVIKAPLSVIPMPPAPTAKIALTAHESVTVLSADLGKKPRQTSGTLDLFWNRSGGKRPAMSLSDTSAGKKPALRPASFSNRPHQRPAVDSKTQTTSLDETGKRRQGWRKYVHFPRSWKEVKKLGWKFIAGFVFFYLVRDLMLYVLLPYLIYSGFFGT